MTGCKANSLVGTQIAKSRGLLAIQEKESWLPCCAELNFCTIQQWLSLQNEVIRVESARKKRVAVQRAALLSALLGDAEFV